MMSIVRYNVMATIIINVEYQYSIINKEKIKYNIYDQINIEPCDSIGFSKLLWLPTI